ncbi:MAG: 50S ribosomal protein L24 [Actinomycetota bacterium]|nr:50S ribosomal protein L24 [Actinomycetota bacterium]
MAKPLKIRKDDTVVITAGKDRGKTGKVVRTEPRKGRVYVENLNIVKRHQRPTSVKETQKGSQVGGIVEKEGPIDISNVMLVDPSNNKPTRVRIERGANGKRVRIAAKSGKAID